jgi:CRISPR/Cas system-associated exonuclease Cas4 (RecB family)
MDEFVKYITSKEKAFRMAPALEAGYLIYTAAQEKSPAVLERRKEFAEFLPWAAEIAAFIDELDLEDIPPDKLEGIQASAAIGYEIPDSINKLLEHIMAIVEAYHAGLRRRNLCSRGLLYKDTARIIAQTNLDEFEKILFCNFYYLHKTEEQIIKHLFDADRAGLFFQKDNSQWPVLERLSAAFGQKIEPYNENRPAYELKIYKGFDVHSQVGLVRHILKQEVLKDPKSLDKSLILLPESNNLIPLLSEISGTVENFNVSMGYPLKRSSLYSLLKYIFIAQSQRKDRAYYTRDYLKVILHPLIKNLMVTKNPAVTRILCHKIEEMLLGMSKTPLSGSLFVNLDDIEISEDLYRFSLDTMLNMDTEADMDTLKKIIAEVHQLAFGAWEEISNFAQLADCLERFSAALLSKSFIHINPLNLKILEKIYEIIDELKTAEFRSLPFGQEEIFKILEAKLKEEKISFSGSPLKGLQILGLLETRSLTFENVIVMDANEAVLPQVSVYEPLIPRQIMEGLGLERLSQEEEIQRYHFMRLIGGAKKVYFVYDDDPQKERSRFLEEIIWQRQKEKKTLRALPMLQDGRFNITALATENRGAKKTRKVIDYLVNDFAYSSSSIDDYLGCPLRFYYQHVLRLREKEDLLDEPEGKDIGNFIHNLISYTFSVFKDKRPVIDAQFEKQFFEEFETHFAEEIQKRMGAEAFMVKEIMSYRLKRFLANERLRKVKQILSLEAEHPIGEIRLGGRPFKFKYRIDRIDLLEDNSILVIDYKTGGSAREPKDLAGLEAMQLSRESIKENINSFQLPIYYYFTRSMFKDRPLNAGLYNLRTIDFSYFIKPKELEKADRIMELCLKALEAVIAEIISPNADFYPDTSDDYTCKRCVFSSLCK